MSLSDNFTSIIQRARVGDDNQYGYTPTRYVGIIFVVLFAITLLTHTFQTVRYRLIWPIPTILLGGVLETAGWAGRLWSSWNPEARSPFMLQIVATILGPTPLLAATFIAFGQLVGVMGSMYSRLQPKYYSIIFVTCDVISLLVQGVGGGIAASGDDNPSQTRNGGNIMLGGIIFQFAVINFFIFFASEFIWRYLTNRPMGSTSSKPKEGSQQTLNVPGRGSFTNNIHLMLYALIVSTTALYIRAVYRTIELADGWTGTIINTEVWFNVFDGAMVVIAFYALNFAHPGRLLGPQALEDKGDVEKQPEIREERRE